jgi:formate hydrogenlyase subunit 6/NADH:ubiquinone oxidoreductase subunit I
MVPYKNDLTIPEINPAICVGCGACEHACPVTDPHVAIFVSSHKEHQVAQRPVIEKVDNVDTEEFPF